MSDSSLRKLSRNAPKTGRFCVFRCVLSLRREFCGPFALNVKHPASKKGKFGMGLQKYSTWFRPRYFRKTGQPDGQLKNIIFWYILGTFFFAPGFLKIYSIRISFPWWGLAFSLMSRDPTPPVEPKYAYDPKPCV